MIVEITTPISISIKVNPEIYFFELEDILEKKMDLIIQITPSVVKDEVAGITKTKAMFDLERSIIETDEEETEEEEQKGENNDN